MVIAFPKAPAVAVALCLGLFPAQGTLAEAVSCEAVAAAQGSVPDQACPTDAGAFSLAGGLATAASALDRMERAIAALRDAVDTDEPAAMTRHNRTADGRGEPRHAIRSKVAGDANATDGQSAVEASMAAANQALERGQREMSAALAEAEAQISAVNQVTQQAMIQAQQQVESALESASRTTAVSAISAALPDTP